MKKQYNTPHLKTERVEIGVFGQYCSLISEGGKLGAFFAFFNPLFRLCCG